jgi:hypothetical protein
MLNLHQEFRALKISLGNAGVRTKSAFVKDIRANKTLKANSPDLNSFLESSAVKWWLSAQVAPFPSENAAQLETCQPFVSQMIEEIENIINNDLKVYREKNDFTESFWKKGTLKVQFLSQPVNCHNTFSFATRKPDIVCYDGFRRGACAITMFGDVKCCAARNNDFPDSEIGQALEMGMDLLKKEQFTRVTLFCFLTDGFRFQFFKCNRIDDDKFTFDQSSVYEGVIGWQVFR